MHDMIVFLCFLVSFSSICLVATAQRCGDEDIRMTNGTVTMDRDTYNLAGGLQICVNNWWSTVCQGEWDDVDGRIACRQLGLDYADRSCHDSCFGNIITGAAYYDLECRGNERILQDCMKVYSTQCTFAVGVYCYLNVSLISSGTASKQNSNSSDSTTESSPPSVSQDSRQSNKGPAATNEPRDGQESSSTNNNAEQALYIVCALLSVALIIVCVGWMGTSIKHRKKKRGNDDIQNVSSENIEADIRNVSPNPIYSVITWNAQVSEDDVLNISSNICYEGIKKECRATLKEV